MRVAELRRLYDLFARIQGLSQIGERFKRYIISTGEAIVLFPFFFWFIFRVSC